MIYIIIMSVIISIFGIGIVYEKISSLKAIILGITNYFFVYVLSSALLFWKNIYSIKKTICLSFALLVIIGTCEYLWKKKKPSFFFQKKDWCILGLVLLGILPMTWQKFGFFGMGQDQGVYQTKAIELVYGNNERIFSFDEYDSLKTKEQKESYIATVKKLAGYDRLDKGKPMMPDLAKNNKTTAIYHGIPTWASILALFAKIFGIAHMQDCQTLFFVLFLMLVFYILENCNIKTLIQIPAVLILGLSPEIIWVSKSALTEMFLAVIVSSFLFLLTEKKENMRFYSWIPVLVFSFYHVTIYTMIPMILFIYWGLAFITKDKRYIRSCDLSIVGYLLGFLFMVYISPTYTTNNYERPLSGLGFVNDDTLIPLVVIISVVALVITNIIPLLMENTTVLSIGKKLDKNKAWICKGIIGIVLCLFIVMCVKNAVSIEQVGQITLVSIMMATGIFVLPIVIVSLLTMSKEKMIGTNWFIIFTLFVYTILIYSVFLRFRCPYYYYYGRYLVPYLFVVVVIFCFLWNEKKKYYLALLAFLGAFYFVQPDYVLYTQQDDTRMSWEVLENLLNKVEGENNAVIISEDLEGILFLPISSTACDVYNEWNDLESEIAFMNDKYENIYYIGTVSELQNAEDFIPIYKNRNQASEDYMTNSQKISAYPLQFQDISNTITLYKYQKSQCEYDVTVENFVGDGFGTVEEGGFAWTNAEQVNVICYLDRDDYGVVLLQGAAIPLGELEIEKYKVDVLINDKYLTTVYIDSENNGENICFDVPKEMLNGRKTKISFRSTLWSPSDYGVNDSRKIGFGFSKMKFYKSDEKSQYDINDEDFIGKGFGEVENDAFAWTVNQEAQVICFLDSKNYQATLCQACEIPLDDMNLDEYRITVYLNGEYLDEISINKRNNGKKVSFDVPKERINKGINTFVFRSDLWSPSDFGSQDIRKLGFSFASIEFKGE